MLSKLPEEYMQDQFDPVLFELQQLPTSFDEQMLDTIVDSRASVLEVVGEKLSLHVLANYEEFVRGVNEVASIEKDLQDAHATAKASRVGLGLTLQDVKANLRVAQRTKKKQGWEALLGQLTQLREASHLHDKLKDAQDNGEYARAFYLCAECCKAMEGMSTLKVAHQLNATVNQLYEQTISRLEGAFASVCNDFRQNQYMRVLDGYVYLGNTATLNEETMNAFANVVGTAAHKVIRGVILTRQGLESKARNTSMVQDLVKLLPPDLFRTCLARMLMVIFDILASHQRMSKWHEKRIQASLREQQTMHTARLDLQQRINSNAQASTSHAEPETAASHHAEHPGQNAASVPASGNGAPHAPSDPGTPKQTATNSHHGPPPLQLLQPPSPFRSSQDMSFVGAAPNSPAGQPSSPNQIGAPGQPSQVHHSANPTEALQVLEQQEHAAMMQAEALLKVQEGLVNGRKWLWDEAARKLGTLLSSPAAFEGEHFLQVLEWTQQILRIGEAFSGAECTSLREVLARQSGKFFDAFHDANLQVLHSMLERELWKKLPMAQGTIPDLASALGGTSQNGLLAKTGSSSSLSASSTTASQNGIGATSSDGFDAYLAQGNPWRASQEAQDAYSEGGSPHKSIVSDDADELYGDSIDEDTQSVKPPVDTAPAPSTSGRLDPEELPTMTNASWRLINWLSEYAELMLMLRSEAGKVYCAMAQMFELYLLHVFYTFSSLNLADVILPQQQQQGGADVLPVRLRNVLLRILNRSLVKYRPSYIPASSWDKLLQHGVANGPSGGPPQPTTPDGQTSKMKDLMSPFSRGPAAGSPESATALSNAGNLYGLQERKVAVDSLMAVASQLHSAHHALTDKLMGRQDLPEQYALDLFYQSVKSSSDVQDFILRTAARLNLPIKWLPDRIAEQNFNLEEPPTKASAWVAVLLNQHLKVFRERLSTMPMLSTADVDQVWHHALQFTAEVMLEGLARAGAKSRCTMMGRAAMSLDLQAVSSGLQNISSKTPRDPAAAAMVADAVRIIDNYIKAFYIPWGDELHRWALTHPEYTQSQILMLVTCIAESNSLKRKDRNALTSQIEADLADMR